MEAKRGELLEICANGHNIAGVFEMLDDPQATVIRQLRAACMATGNLHFSLRPRHDELSSAPWRLTIRTESKRPAGSSAAALTKELRLWAQVCRWIPIPHASTPRTD